VGETSDDLIEPGTNRTTGSAEGYSSVRNRQRACAV